MNKKILAILMALLMVAMSTVAMAAEGIVDVNANSKEFMTINKTYTLNGAALGNENAPKEVLEFEAAYAGVTDNETGAGPATAPSVTVKSKAAGEYTVQTAVTATLTETPKTGLYKFTITEKAAKEAGVVYSDQSFDVYVLVAKNSDGAYTIKTIYVMDGAKKTDAFTYTNNIVTGSVKIKKAIEGTLADVNAVFPVTVTMETLEGESVTHNNTEINASAVTGKTQPTKAGDFVDGKTSTTEVWVTNDTEITISNIPEGVKVTVAENVLTVDGINYKTSLTDENNNKTIAAGENGVFEITNTADAQHIPTGVFTDNMPYFMLLAFVMILAAAVVLKKRTVNE